MDTDRPAPQPEQLPAATQTGGNGHGQTAPPDGWLSVSSAAFAAGVNKRTMRRYAQRGEASAVRIGADWYIKPGTWPPRSRNGRPGGVVPAPATVDLSAFADKLITLAQQVGHWRTVAEESQKLLTGGQADAARVRADADRARIAADQATAELAGLRRRDRRLTAELIGLAVVGIAAAIL